MGGPRMNTLTECARHGAAIKVICKRCGNERGEPDISILRFVCQCGARRFHSFAQRGVPRHMRSPLPMRPERRDDDEAL